MSRTIDAGLLTALTSSQCEPFFAIDLMFDTTTRTFIGQTITAGDFVVGNSYQIVSIGTTDFTTVGANSNTVGDSFVATGVGSGTGTVHPVFDVGPLYLWTGIGDRTIGSNTYLGTGQMLTLGGMEEVSDLSAKAMSLTLEGVDSSIVSIALQEPYQRRQAKVYMGEKSSSSVVQIFSGQMDQMSIEDSGETSVINLVIESKLVELERARNWRYTHESHKSRYSNDSFFTYVQDIQDKSIAWGRKPK